MQFKQEKTRESSFELLRIVSMLMIVFLHIGTHGLNNYINVADHLGGINEIAYFFIRSLSYVSVNIYVLISGYFLSKSNFKFTKLARLFFEVSFFSMIIYLVGVIFGSLDFSVLSLFGSLFSIFFGEYWFATVYFVLYSLSPFLNTMIKNLEKQKFAYLIIILFVMLCVWLFLIPIENIGNGTSLVHFIFLYLIAAYIRKYPIRTKRINKNVCLSVNLLLASTNTLWTFFSNENLGGAGAECFYEFNSPVVVIMSVALFLYFKELTIYSPKINYIAKYVFGVYLVHEHTFMRELIWKNIGIIENVISTNNFMFVVKTIVYSLLVFSVSWFFSWILSEAYKILFNKAYLLSTDKE